MCMEARLANVKISQLPAIGALAGTDLFPLVQGTSTNKAPISSLDGRYLRKGQSEAPGSELAYAQITAAVTLSTGTAATALTVVSTGAVTFDGSDVLLEFFCSQIQTPASPAGSAVMLNIWDGSTDLGFWGQAITPAAGVLCVPFNLKRKLTPSAGTHTYMVKGFSTVGTNGVVGAGVGGLNLLPPAFLRITKV